MVFQLGRPGPLPGYAYAWEVVRSNPACEFLQIILVHWIWCFVVVLRAADLCWALRRWFAILPQFCSIFNIGRDEPRPQFCLGEQIRWRPKKGLYQKWNTSSLKSGEDQRKKVFTKNETLFFPEFKWITSLRCTPEWKYCEGDADVDHTQTIGGDTVKSGFRHPWLYCIFYSPVTEQRQMLLND